MFKDLRTSTKIIILCALFILTIAATTYSLVAEKQIAINFARQELLGTDALVPMRAVYAAVLLDRPFVTSSSSTVRQRDDIREALSVQGIGAGDGWQLDGLSDMLAIALERLWSNDLQGGVAAWIALDTLDKARQLMTRIADESKLSLDPDIDTYYLQDLIARKLPAFLRQVGEVQIAYLEGATAQRASASQRARFPIHAGLLRSAVDEVNRNVEAAYRGSPDGSLRVAIGDAFAEITSSTTGYLDDLSASFDNADAIGLDAAAAERLYGRVIDRAIGAWRSAQSELADRLQRRIDGFVERRHASLLLVGVLVALSIVVAVMTHRHTVRPLERLEEVATAVGETKNYDLRVDYAGTNEFGKLAATFNDMLSELAAAREREESERFELARVERLTTMGEMAASLAHEVNQPLAAIVANSKAAERWLSRAPPALDEALNSLASIARDGHRASDVIASVRSMFKKDVTARSLMDVNQLVLEVLTLLRSELHRHDVQVETDLSENLPPLVADRVQMQQVLSNLVTNAVEAMSLTEGERELRIGSGADGSGDIIVTIEDTGPGIGADDLDRIFEAFYTTKPTGMGLGLAICRSIIEFHGGRLTAALAKPHGTGFRIVLPKGEADSE
jgi:signal transduction histidine kinase